MRHTFPTKKCSAGFTIVELLIAVSLSAVVVTVFIALLFSTYQASGRNKLLLSMTSSMQIALSQMERDVRYSAGYDKSVAVPFNDSNSPAGGWTYKGTPASPENRALLLRSYATVNNPFSPQRQSAYVDGRLPNPYVVEDPLLNCSITPPAGALYLNPQLPYMTIYFLSNGSLVRRILTDTTTTLCNGASVYQKQSCPGGTGGSCRAKDEVILENVSSFAIDYFQQLDTPIPTFSLLDVYADTNPDDLAAADNISITLTVQNTLGGETISRSMSVTVSRINN